MLVYDPNSCETHEASPLKTLTQSKLAARNRLLASISNLVVALIVFGAVPGAYAQGLVYFINTSATLISANIGGQISAINGPVGSYYFGLLIASPGTTDPKAFAFTGVYATNVIGYGPGMISGGTEVQVPGWGAGTMRSFMVCGWDAKGGPTFNTSWLNGTPPFGMSFGMSPIAVGVAGGFDSQTGIDLPALNIFGPDTVWSGFALPIPNLCLSCNPPVICVQPQDQSTTTGMTVQFMVGCGCGGAFEVFRWFCNGFAMAGASNSFLELTNVSLSQNGNQYYVIVTNPWGSAQSATATLTVKRAPPVDFRSVPGLAISGQQGITLEVTASDAIGSSASWSNLQNLVLTTNRNWSFDLSGSSTQRFYRTVRSSSPGSGLILELHMVPAITLTGAIGSHIRIDYLYPFGTTSTWSSLANVLLTNSPQLYFDISAIGQPPRMYSLIPQ